MEGRAPDFSLIESVIIDAACSLPALSVYVAVRCPSGLIDSVSRFAAELGRERHSSTNSHRYRYRLWVDIC